jgi:hypothetical protein
MESAALVKRKSLFRATVGGAHEVDSYASGTRNGGAAATSREWQPDAKPAGVACNWLKCWSLPDPRRVSREPAPGLAAHFWTGAAPEAHRVRDVSSSGLYLVTDER